MNSASVKLPLSSTYLELNSTWWLRASPSGSVTEALTRKVRPAGTAEALSTVNPLMTGGVLSPEVEAPYASFTA
ncbi:hypothetical protein SCYAM73S_01183 [Streptomyces cyaneofuscatus]